MEQDLLNEFLTEAQEHLCTVEDDILTLERGGGTVDQLTVNRLFRAVHTIKGGAGFLNMLKVKDLSHSLENVVGAIRSNELVPDQRVSEVLLDGIDRLRYLLEHTEETDAAINQQVANCVSLLQKEGSTPVSGAGPVPAGNAPTPAFDLARYDLAPLIANQQRVHVIKLDLVTECTAKQRSIADLIAEFNSIGVVLDTEPEADGGMTITPDASGHRWLSLVLGCIIDEKELLTAGIDISPVWHEIYKPSAIRPAAAITATPPPAEKKEAAATATIQERQPQQAHQSQPGAPASGGEQTVRITLGLIDRLMNLASELVLVRNQYLRSIAAGDLQRLAGIGQRLNVVTSDIQSSIMQTRMRPIGTIFNRFSRVVRDLAHKLGKKINLEIRGAEVELDKSIVEAMGDPMTHLVRNAVDHGIEMPDVRLATGKPAEGVVCLSAFHQAGRVIIQIDDDGKGRDPKFIVKKAIEKGLLSEAQAPALSEREIFDLIFVPGFSTAEKITEVSGRGVGMDVVRSGIQSLGGTIAISSTPGLGSTIRIELPLTLAILPALIVEVESSIFAIPQVNIIEVVWLHGSDVFQNIRKIDDREVYWLRGTLLPLLRLSKVLNIQRTYVDPQCEKRKKDRRVERPDRRQDSKGLPTTDDRRTGPVDRRVDLSNSLYVVVLRLGSERFGLIVDTVIDTEEIVVKSLHDQLQTCRAYAGTAVLGNGRVAMILDILACAELGSLQVGTSENKVKAAKGSYDDRQTVLQFNIGGPERFAVPLCLITRVQELQQDQIKHVHGREYLNYRNNLIPLVRIDQTIPDFTADYSIGALSVIIPKSQNIFGVVVSRIIDTIEVPTTIDTGTIQAPCIIGTQLLQGDPTLFIDLLGLMTKIDPAWNRHADRGDETGQRYLVVDDSAFYQNLLASFLRSSGADVATANNGSDGLEKLTHEKFDAVICDIEMPVLDGFGFIKAVRERHLADGIPMLAVSTGEERYLRPRAIDSGFDDFKPKGSLEDLLGAVDKMILGKKATVAPKGAA